jgi:hypothetical protein
MFTDQYKLYLADTIKLLKTMTIKSLDSADRVNDLMKLKYGEASVDKYDLTTWKYYRNISGLYHSTDTVMTIVSLDTLELIDFTQDNLALHTETRVAYDYGTRYYDALVMQYPNQEKLILGILYPCDIESAIDAKDGTILSYSKQLVEEQEITLLTELQEWIWMYLIRWHVRAFSYSDSLYPVAQHAIMYLNAVPKLLNLRLKRCKTYEAHSFHIRQYLASHGRLDVYMDYMTRKQQLFLYRNVAYIEHNNGKIDIFKWLLEKLLSDRYIPIAEFSGRHTNDFNAKYEPLYLFRKKPLNTQYNVPEKDYFSLKELLVKEYSTARGNQEYALTQFDSIDRKFLDSASSVIQTKDLESSMLDFTDAVSYPLTDILVGHWAYMSANGLYTAVINFKDPISGDNKILTAADAFVFMQYILLKSYGIDVLTVPSYFANRIQRPVKPTVEDVMSVVDRSYITNNDTANWLIQKQPNMKPCLSKSSFFKFCSAVYDTGVEQWRLVSRTEHMYTRALVDNMVNRMYTDNEIKFPDHGKPMLEWLAIRDLDVTGYSVPQLGELANAIFNASTGFNVDPTKFMRNIQAAMIATMKQLSSYTIQFIRAINSSAIKPLNWAAIRIGNIRSTFIGKQFIPVSVRVLNESFAGLSSCHVNIPLTITTQSKNIVKKKVAIDLPLVTQIASIHKTNAFIRVNNLGMTASSDVDTDERYDAFTDEQKRSLLDIYTTHVTDQGLQSVVDINSVIINRPTAMLVFIGGTFQL